MNYQNSTSSKQDNETALPVLKKQDYRTTTTQINFEDVLLIEISLSQNTNTRQVHLHETFTMVKIIERVGLIYCLMESEFHFCKIKHILEMDSSDDCTTI